MAAKHSLLDLVSHLQSMETAITTTIFENAIRLASLTEAGVFILIETEKGRQFYGKKHLADAYLQGILAPAGNEVQMEFDSNATLLKEHDCNFSIAVDCVTDKSLRNSLKRQNENSDSMTKVKRICLKDTSTDIKEEEIEECLIISDEEESFKESSFDEEMSLESSRQTHFVMNSVDLSSQEKCHYNSSIKNAMLCSSDPSKSDPSLLIDLTSLDISIEKMEALSATANQQLLFQRGSVENKLLASVFYDFGKELAVHFPAIQYPYVKLTMSDSNFKKYFELNFKRFCARFLPNLSHDYINSAKICIGTRQYSGWGYIRKNVCDGVNMRTKQKK